MVVLRLRRGGRRHDPHYRVVVQEKRSKLNGSYIENIGHYHPAHKDKELVINAERATFWLNQGAQASTTVNNLLVKAGVLAADRKISRVYKTPVKKAEEAAPAAKPTEAPAEETAAETAEEAPAEAAEPESEPAAEPEEAPAQEEPAA